MDYLIIAIVVLVVSVILNVCGLINYKRKEKYLNAVMAELRDMEMELIRKKKQQ